MSQPTDLARILSKLKIEALNEIQNKCISAFDESHDIVLIAPTGSGKTLAFLLPILIHIAKTNDKAIIIAPSRELVLQIENVARTMAMGLHIIVCYGGHSIRTEVNALQSSFQLIIGTPGRLADHLRRGNMNGNDFKYCVLDEFDKSLEIGFHQEMMEIVGQATCIERYILTSATEAIPIPDFVKMKRSVKIVDLSEQVRSKLVQWRVMSPFKDKLSTLFLLVKDLLPSSIIVFCNYKESVERVADYLKGQGMTCNFFHGGLDQLERELILAKFRNGSNQILVATDLAARGLDIPIVANIVHYHLPHSEEEFIHRNGRTARMGATGASFIIQFEDEDLASYINPIPKLYYPDESKPLIHQLEWVALKINRGKKDRINKVDVVGYLCQMCGLDKDEIGTIEIKDQITVVAVDHKKVDRVINVNGHKLKGRSIKTEIL